MLIISFFRIFGIIRVKLVKFWVFSGKSEIKCNEIIILTSKRVCVKSPFRHSERSAAKSRNLF